MPSSESVNVIFSENERDFIVEICRPSLALTSTVLDKLSMASADEQDNVCCLLSMDEIAQLVKGLVEQSNKQHDGGVCEWAYDLAMWLKKYDEEDNSETLSVPLK